MLLKFVEPLLVWERSLWSPTEEIDNQSDDPADDRQEEQEDDGDDEEFQTTWYL